MFSLAVFGCGYVGLATGACLSSLGNSVRCYDTDATKLRALQRGDVPFYEPALAQLIAAESSAGRLSFTYSAREALHQADAVFIAVGTPIGPTGEADLTYVRQAAEEIAGSASGSLIVVNKSTVPVETADMVERIVERAGDRGCRFSVASNPEFLREGSAVADFLHPDRIVIGSSDERAIALLRTLYAPLGAPIHVVDVRTAEMIKYAANAFLATKISFVNEIANLCAAVGADVDGVVDGIGSDARIGRSYLQPGLGFGGSCLPKDVAALADVSRRHGIEPTMLEATLSVNRRQVVAAVRLIEDAAGDLYGTPLAVAGLAFKGGTDDVRDSPSLVLVEALLARGATVAVYDSYATRAARRQLRDRVRYCATPYEACRGAKALIVANDDRAYANLDWARVAASLDGDRVVDLRNRLTPHDVEGAGLRYTGIGRSRKRAVTA